MFFNSFLLVCIEFYQEKTKEQLRRARVRKERLADQQREAEERLARSKNRAAATEFKRVRAAH